MTLSRNIRRVSLRVVNMAGMGIEEHVRLADVEDEKVATDDEEEESRELNHEEIWDDSALIDAWNSAAAEYEVCPLTPTTAMVRD